MREFMNSIWENTTKWQKFFIIIISIVVIATFASFVAKVFFLAEDYDDRYRVVAVVPSESEDKQNLVAREMRRGVEVFINIANERGGYDDKNIEIDFVDENLPTSKIAPILSELLENPKTLGVVGFSDREKLSELMNVIDLHKKPVVTPLENRDLKDNKNLKSIGLSRDHLSMFVANYARNVNQHRIMYIVSEDESSFIRDSDLFSSVYDRFGTPVRERFIIPSSSSEEALKKLTESFKKIDIGAIFISASDTLSAKIIKSIKDSGSEFDIYGLDVMSTNSFKSEILKVSKDVAKITNGVIVPSQIIFDTANEEAQNFQNSYNRLYKSGYPDRISSSMYDATKLIIGEFIGKSNISDSEVYDRFVESSYIDGIQGKYNFVEGNDGKLPIKMGIFNGESLISAPIQLQPILRGSMTNYIEALRDGRVLFVNDRFMYKTNVVYTGIKINSIDNLKPQDETADIDFSIWFRYQGNFSPENIIFTNAVGNFKLEKAEEIIEKDGMNYRLYNAKHTFKINFTSEPKAYGVHNVGLEFRHKKFNYNNLLFVTDVLGMPNNNEMLKEIRERKIISTTMGWKATNVAISQELNREFADGKPHFVGYSGDEPLFSNISAVFRLEPTMISAKDFIEREYFIYLAIFGVIGFLFIRLMDRKKLSRYWDVQSWIMRVIFYPILLISVGNIVLDYVFNKTDLDTTIFAVIIYDSLWWIMPAFIINLAIKRFVWQKVEEKSGKKIPGIMILLVSFLIYALAFAGITAFVFNETLTSLLAASGVLALVVGMAIKANIANIFSGIILNMERPFKVGEVIKTNGIAGEVVDISWRTTKIRAKNGSIVNLPNAKISEALVENIDRGERFRHSHQIYTHPKVDPTIVLPLIVEALNSSETIILKDDGDFGIIARFSGVEIVNDVWVGVYTVLFTTEKSVQKGKVVHEIWSKLWNLFQEHNIEFYTNRRVEEK